MKYKIRIALVSLGCPKNLVDSELMLGQLNEKGYVITPDEGSADVIIVNTCAFVADARKESMDALRSFVRLKKRGRCKAVIAAGCLPQKYADIVAGQLPEVDAVVGLGKHTELPDVIERVLEGKHLMLVGEAAFDGESSMPRMLATPPWTAYLRIADGCDIRCTFCIIPDIRGSYRSRPIEDLVDEARRLAAGGVRELVLIAQDTTGYGQDIYRRLALPELVEKLGEIKDIRWIRILYTYPTRIHSDLVRIVAEHPKVCRYLDIPLQHADDDILGLMKRAGKREELYRVVSNLRRANPDIALRSSFIVGFPGESEERFRNLADFLEEVELDWAGVFRYSMEEGTPAAMLPDQVPEKVAVRRYERLMRIQQAITRRRNERWVGRKVEVLIEGFTPEGVAYGRTERQAPDIDGITYVIGGNADPGSFIPVRIKAVHDYDLEAEVIIR